MQKQDEKFTQQFDKTAQIWTMLEEYYRVQQLYQEEEVINTTIQEMK